MPDTIEYGNLMHRAMRGLIQEVLEDVARDGLPGEHHFFITFDTLHPDVEIADWLSDRYPEEMTIVMQHWFENLNVTDEGFSVTLNFGDNPEPLYIPFDAIRTFVDPSVEFGLRFESQDEDDDGDEAEVVEIDELAPARSAPQAAPATATDTAPAKSSGDGDDDSDSDDQKDAEVVSLYSFRK